MERCFSSERYFLEFRRRSMLTFLGGGSDLTVHKLSADWWRMLWRYEHAVI